MHRPVRRRQDRSVPRARDVRERRALPRARAREIGLVHEVVPTPSDLDQAVERLVSNMLQCGPKAMAAAKKLVLDLSWPEKRSALGDSFEHVSRLLAELRVSPEGQEGLKAFLEKRKPSWMKS
jgi:methylglutaconyl-CoA hydratase